MLKVKYHNFTGKPVCLYKIYIHFCYGSLNWHYMAFKHLFDVSSSNK